MFLFLSFLNSKRNSKEISNNKILEAIYRYHVFFIDCFRIEFESDLAFYFCSLLYAFHSIPLSQCVFKSSAQYLDTIHYYVHQPKWFNGFVVHFIVSHKTVTLFHCGGGLNNEFLRRRKYSRELHRRMVD